MRYGFARRPKFMTDIKQAAAVFAGVNHALNWVLLRAIDAL
jgi:hypothetical protein